MKLGAQEGRKVDLERVKEGSWGEHDQDILYEISTN